MAALRLLTPLNSAANLKDDGAALECYLQIAAATKNNGSANFSGVQGVARILTKRGECDEALVTLHRVDIDQRRGHWRRSMLLALGETFAAAGRAEEAMTAFQAVTTDDSIETSHRTAAEQRIKAIGVERE